MVKIYLCREHRGDKRHCEAPFRWCGWLNKTDKLLLKVTGAVRSPTTSIGTTATSADAVKTTRCSSNLASEWGRKWWRRWLWMWSLVPDGLQVVPKLLLWFQAKPSSGVGRPQKRETIQWAAAVRRMLAGRLGVRGQRGQTWLETLKGSL